jgi:hypothetical protein
MFKTTRRGFMIGCSTAIASMTGGLSFTAFGAAEAEPNQDILVVVFFALLFFLGEQGEDFRQ